MSQIALSTGAAFCPSIIPPLEAKPVKQCILKLTKIKLGGRYIIYNAKYSIVSVLLSSASCTFRVGLFHVLARHMKQTSRTIID